MKKSFLKKKILLRLLLGMCFLLGTYGFIEIAFLAEKKEVYLKIFQEEEKISFNEEIRPILNAKCISCHGGVKQSGGFSLLFREEALRLSESGKPAIVPGQPEESELIHRIKHHDPELRMPAKAEALAEEEIELLEKWIAQGAQWEMHWAYIKPEKQTVPDLSSDWVENDIDRFILGKLKENDLMPSSPADKKTLLRRVSLDLTGLPPTQKALQNFLEDGSPAAYEKVVDKLLDSPKYGERWASMWMDLARYADSKGYEKDGYRSIWQYRDWLIKAFNEDKPYDKFLIEQLAGDLLPEPTDEQLIATAFHRNTLSNDEGGTDNEEFRVAAVIDRVSTTWNALQGTTMECVQCHSHPTEPLRHESFYKSYAYFNNTADEDLGKDSPNLKTFTSSRDQENLENIKRWVLDHTSEQEIRSEKVSQFVNLVRLTEPKMHFHFFDKIEEGSSHTDADVLVMNAGGQARLKNVPLNGSSEMLVRYNAPRNSGKMEIRIGNPKGKLLTNWRIRKSDGTETISVPISSVDGNHDLYFLFEDPGKNGAIFTLKWILFYKGLPGGDKPDYPSIKRQFLSLLNSKDIIKTPVMVELDGDYRRRTHIFERGNRLVLGKEVQPGVPEVMNPIPRGAPANRLGFARWITSKDNPITARVMVNRLWAQLFGTGIVETQENFGSLGSPPSHPELLDWLALQFMQEHNWSIKKQLKLMVMSATYRQSSKITPDIDKIDPNNRLLARGPRVRLTGEQIRDQGLRVSGLLSEKMYGPSVMPVQPEGLWKTVYSGLEWKTSSGEDQHRRALYTFWRRSNPYPSLVTFDSPDRNVCVVRRINTNTPLQALVTLNDPAYIEMAKGLATRMRAAGGGSSEGEIKFGYRLALIHDIEEEELQDLQLLYEQALQHFTENPGAAKELINENDIKLASLTMVASVIMNLDEFLTKT